VTHPNNAAYQARWRARQKAKLAQVDNGFALYVRASRPLVEALQDEGAKNMATMVPACVARYAALLGRLTERWGTLDQKAREDLAEAGTVSKISRLLPNLT
jgi:hypothetical protein